ncbi:MAG: diguanylate cyclase [Anaerolineae bacterium]|nr:diguanylate cyclase [Anaerolineae bacterium]MBT7074634.1 diguanylate cyclase [Anaerolineae bacterium]MBT7782853.1 diguanylate cyclase [Anaerolineae bacterium]
MGASQLDASQRTEEWRKKFGASNPTDLDIKVTFSAGIASFPEDGKGMDHLFMVADRRLYLAKEAGRNRVCDWRDDLKN